MTNAPEVFNSQAMTYNPARRRLIPPFDSFYGTAVQAVALSRRSPTRILDLGAGTGLLSAYVREVFPEAHLTLVDGAAQMLEQAREALGDRHTEYQVADLTDPLPDGPWDAIVSSLAIHHLDDGEKRDLFARVRATLAEGGVFVNAEQVTGGSPLFTGVYARWHEQRARAAGSDDAEWEAAEGRMAFDRCSSVEDQLTWLREAGFGDVDCLFKDHRFAVIVALNTKGS
jgi:tRNA (cmo5U34)-methyltransferase